MDFDLSEFLAQATINSAGDLITVRYELGLDGRIILLLFESKIIQMHSIHREIGNQ